MPLNHYRGKLVTGEMMNDDGSALWLMCCVAPVSCINGWGCVKGRPAFKLQCSQLRLGVRGAVPSNQTLHSYVSIRRPLNLLASSSHLWSQPPEQRMGEISEFQTQTITTKCWKCLKSWNAAPLYFPNWTMKSIYLSQSRLVINQLVRGLLGLLDTHWTRGDMKYGKYLDSTQLIWSWWSHQHLISWTLKLLIIPSKISI